MEYQSGNIFIREMAFEKAGDVVDGHMHNFDHTTYIVRGSVKIDHLKITPATYRDEDYYIDKVWVINEWRDVRKLRLDAVPLTPEVTEVVRSVVKRAVDGHNWVLIKADVCHRLTALPPDESAMADKLTAIVMQMREVSREVSREEMQEKLKAALEEDASSMGHCLYSHRNPQGEIVEAYDGWMEGYV